MCQFSSGNWFFPPNSCTLLRLVKGATIATPLWAEDETHTPKSGNLESSGIPKNSESIAGVKTPHIEVFFISMERSWIVDVQNGLVWAIWTSAAQVMIKEGPGVKLAVWLPTTKSRESISSRRLQKECNMALESSQGELQLWFRPHSNRRSKPGDMNAQSPGSSTRNSFGTSLWESREKVLFECGSRGVTQRILYRGLPLSSSRDESSESKVARGLSQHQMDVEWI